MTAILTAGDALLREVLEVPGDDTPRLVLADWLEEHGEPDRAEFIRVQVALARLAGEEGASVADDCQYPRGWGPGERALHRQARELFGRNGHWSVLRFPDEAPYGGWVYHAPEWLHWRRGFLRTLVLPSRAFLDRARLLFAAHPVTEVRLSDREPFDHAPRGKWRWQSGYVPFEPARPDMIPMDLFRLLPRYGRDSHVYCWYDSEAGAHADLSAAAVRFGRTLNRLP
jgi:uncharacterized protein (TIGR02996 family)